MTSKPVFGFYGGWATYRSGKGRCTVEDLNPDLCTHLIYAFVEPKDDGTLIRKDDNEKNAMENFNDLRKRNPRLKTLVSFGGANCDKSVYAKVAADSILRKSFAVNVRGFCIQYGFNGADIDWEFPESSSDHSNFVLLLSALASELHSHDLILTTSVGVNREYDVSGIARHVDYILLMSYDYNGTWDRYTGHNAPLCWGTVETDYQRRLNVKASVSDWIGGGAPKSKLIIGLAAYGRTFTLTSTSTEGTRRPTSGPGRKGPYTDEAGIVAYYEVKNMFEQRMWDSEQHVPYAVSGDQWVSYDNPQSIQKKCEFINSESLGGAMIWSIDQDEFQEDKFTLLRTVVKCLNPVEPTCLEYYKCVLL
uniref:GH18 domain-containing protein n=1 Tax=Anopheles coluzzii TaxID=1518534 RepID=A0A8W7P2Z7_ANOCL